MDFTPDPDVVEIADNLLRFIDREVLPMEHEHRQLFASERTIFDESGRYVPKVLELRRQDLVPRGVGHPELVARCHPCPSSVACSSSNKVPRISLLRPTNSATTVSAQRTVTS